MKSAPAIPVGGHDATAAGPSARWRRRLWGWSWRLALAGVVVWWVGHVALGWMPLPRSLRSGFVGVTRTELRDRHGTSLRVQAGDDGRVGRELAEADIPRFVIATTLAAEDARFYRHDGVDPLATLRAAGQWVRHRRVVSGASTITQQLIKLAEPRPRTLDTKVVEALQAWRLERDWDKSRILRAYLGRIDYGNGCAGLAEAARHYFGKYPADLDLAEAAFLAGLPQAPSRLNPRRRFARAKARQEWILSRCHQLGWIDAAQLHQALEAPVRLLPPGRDFAAPHFVEYALGQRAALGSAVLLPDQVTTLDLPLQRRCEEIVRQQLAGLKSYRVGDAAVVVLDNRTGDVLAMVGSGDWSRPDSGQVNGALARRSPGSALKPFTFLLAFSDGATAADVVPDVLAEFATPTGVFQPLNYDRHCRGPVSLREALGNSLNLPAVRVLAQHGGPARLQTQLQTFGLTTLERRPDEYGLGLTLGSGEVRLLELANAYATLARLGDWRPVRALTAQAIPPPRRVASADACWLVADVLHDPAARSTTFGLETPLRCDFPVACKTGTSSDFRDNWAFGFTPEFTVGLWVGNFDGTAMAGVSGVVGAAPILHDVLSEVHARYGTSWFSVPGGVQTARVEPLTGHRLNGEGGGRTEVFLPGTLPPEASPADYDGRDRVRLPSEYAAWAASADNRWGERVVVVQETSSVAAGEPLRILTPLPGTVLFLDGDVPSASQRLTLRASGPCQWHCTSLVLAERTGRTEASLALGRHQLRAVDPATGRTTETWIEVRRL